MLDTENTQTQLLKGYIEALERYEFIRRKQENEHQSDGRMDISRGNTPFS